jgi:hypothetical protein
MDANDAALVVLTAFVGSLAWDIRELLESTVSHQKGILAELISSRLRE